MTLMEFIFVRTNFILFIVLCFQANTSETWLFNSFLNLMIRWSCSIATINFMLITAKVCGLIWVWGLCLLYTGIKILSNPPQKPYNENKTGMLRSSP